MPKKYHDINRLHVISYFVDGSTIDEYLPAQDARDRFGLIAGVFAGKCASKLYKCELTDLRYVVISTFIINLNVNLKSKQK